MKKFIYTILLSTVIAICMPGCSEIKEKIEKEEQTENVGETITDISDNNEHGKTIQKIKSKYNAPYIDMEDYTAMYVNGYRISIPCQSKDLFECGLLDEAEWDMNISDIENGINDVSEIKIQPQESYRISYNYTDKKENEFSYDIYLFNDKEIEVGIQECVVGGFYTYGKLEDYNKDDNSSCLVIGDVREKYDRLFSSDYYSSRFATADTKNYFEWGIEGDINYSIEVKMTEDKENQNITSIGLYYNIKKEEIEDFARLFDNAYEVEGLAQETLFPRTTKDFGEFTIETISVDENWDKYLYYNGVKIEYGVTVNETPFHNLNNTEVETKYGYPKDFKDSVRVPFDNDINSTFKGNDGLTYLEIEAITELKEENAVGVLTGVITYSPYGESDSVPSDTSIIGINSKYEDVINILGEGTKIQDFGDTGSYYCWQKDGFCLHIYFNSLKTDDEGDIVVGIYVMPDSYYAACD